MAQSSSDLNTIHLRKLATPGRKYYGDNEKVYLGTETGRLKLLELSLDTVSGITTPNIVNNITNTINNIVSNGIFTFDKGIIAFAGSGQLNATQLVADYNRIDIAATLYDSVKVKPAIGKMRQIVRNFGAFGIYVYPTLGDHYRGLAVDIPILIAPKNTKEISCYEGEDGTLTVY